MKINIDIDMSPEEARKIMGLPDIEPMQKEILAKMQEKMLTSLDEMSDPELLMKRFLPLGIQSMEQFQKFFTSLANAATGTNGNSAKDKK